MKRRASGVLLHITSLPSPYGIGDLGPAAHLFVDFLVNSCQGFWQILPLNPTSTMYGSSPYSSYSAFAGNPLLISPDLLVQEGFLTKKDVGKAPFSSSKRADFKAVTEYKALLFHKAYEQYQSRIGSDQSFLRFCHENTEWLEDYALFVALKAHFQGSVWSRWPQNLRDRREEAIRAWKEKLRAQMIKEKFVQYLFFRQWDALKAYCRANRVQIIGDLPIYVHYHSADVWAHPDLFLLDEKKRPSVVSGFPPDYYSATGQLWGNPIYRWDVLKEREYDWWVKRVTHNIRLFELVRLDHFMGFVQYWEVKAHYKTAMKGRWVKGPREGFFNTLMRNFPSLPFIAEDLGLITSDVREVRDRYALPGMRILQFAFSDNSPMNPYKPTQYIQNCVAYTGTHDNNTLMGWLYGTSDHSTRKLEEIQREREHALQYLGYRGKGKKDIHWEFIRLLMMSVANLVITPMQDLLGLGEEARMNRPATAHGNWEWRLHPGKLTPSLVKRLSEMTVLYGRK